VQKRKAKRHLEGFEKRESGGGGEPAKRERLPVKLGKGVSENLMPPGREEQKVSNKGDQAQFKRGSRLKYNGSQTGRPIGQLKVRRNTRPMRQKRV